MTIIIGPCCHPFNIAPPRISYFSVLYDKKFWWYYAEMRHILACPVSQYYKIVWVVRVCSHAYMLTPAGTDWSCAAGNHVMWGTASLVLVEPGNLLQRSIHLGQYFHSRWFPLLDTVASHSVPAAVRHVAHVVTPAGKNTALR
jgi:hypothetical protein